jgi:hypothetical protein
MKISVRRSGGFANIGAHAEVDTSTLPREKADALQRLVRGASLPDQPPPPLRSAQAADAYQYDITVDDGKSPKTYRADDLTMPDTWRSLVDFLLKQGKP